MRQTWPLILGCVSLLLLFCNLYYFPRQDLSNSAVVTITTPPCLIETLPPSPSPMIKKEDKRDLIHLPLSVTSRFLNKVTHFEHLPLFRHALPSLIKTAEPWKFRYDIGIGADKGDRFYDDPQQVVAMKQWWIKAWQHHWNRTEGEEVPPTLWFMTYDNTQSRNVWAVNYISQRAYEQGEAHWFYRINDDTELHLNNWSSAFVQELQSYWPIPGLGVTGPYDALQKGKLLTHSFVGRLHFDVFGFHFPFTFGNSWSDTWIDEVYQNITNSTMHSRLAHISVRHVYVKSRYNTKGTADMYKQQLSLDRTILWSYLKNKGDRNKEHH